MTMLQKLRQKLKNIFSTQAPVPQTASVLIEEANPPLYAATCEVELRKREAVAADEALRIFRIRHTLDVGPAYDALFTASRDAGLRLDAACHRRSEIERSLGLRSQLQPPGGKHV
jgi:hypothetical protein